MKITVALLLLVLSFVTCRGQGQFEVIVTGFKERKGFLRVGLFNESRHFLKRPVDSRVVALSADSASVTFKNLPPGEYAVSVFHDQNNNEELDTNAIGIPREGFAFGNNAMGMFGPPSFEKCSVVIRQSSVRQILKLRHF
jgi:uncharacterized protein (DUF2141 family)